MEYVSLAYWGFTFSSWRTWFLLGILTTAVVRVVVYLIRHRASKYMRTIKLDSKQLSGYTLKGRHVEIKWEDISLVLLNTQGGSERSWIDIRAPGERIVIHHRYFLDFWNVLKHLREICQQHKVSFKEFSSDGFYRDTTQN